MDRSLDFGSVRNRVGNFLKESPYGDAVVRTSGASVAQSAEQRRLSPQRSWVRFSPRTRNTDVKRFSQRSSESRWFSPDTAVSSHKESLQGGLR